MKETEFPAWFCQPPAQSQLGDHSVIQLGDYLKEKSVAVLITGSVAAMKAPLLVRLLRKYGARVTVFASPSALNFVGEDSLSWAANRPLVKELSPKSEHLNGSKPFDCYLLAPASYNSINKLAAGVADTLVTTTLASAMGFLAQKQTTILVAPAMHGSMHNPLLSENLIKLYKLGVRFIKPRQAFGKNNLASLDYIVAAVCRAVSSSPVKGKRILVTGGATPVKIDSIRRLTNCFSGKLGIEIASRLFLKGADVILLQSAMGIRPPAWLPHRLYDDFDQYADFVLEETSSQKAGGPALYGVFSAAVADYKSKSPHEGKVASGYSNLQIELVATPKVIDGVSKVSDTKIISFKYEHDADVSELSEIAAKRLDNGSIAVVGNSGKTMAEQHCAYLFTKKGDPVVCKGKDKIAGAISTFIENDLTT